MQVIAIAMGGALGAVCRHLVNVACSHWLALHAAWGTFVVNAVGCFLLGVLIPLGTGGQPRWNAITHSALTVGFLGAFTTFSTFGWETYRLLESGENSAAALSVAANMTAGLMAVSAGLTLGRLVAG